MTALDNLNSGLSMVIALIDLESKYADPPSDEDAKAVYALRGASIVLLVSTFEEFLRIRTQEAVKNLNSHLHDHREYDFDKLPKRLLINHYHLTLKYAIEGSRHDGLKPEDRIPAIQSASGDIVANRLDPVAFSQTHSNPNSATLKGLLYNVGIDDSMRELKPYYESAAGKVVADRFIEDNSDALISLRNVASHAINSMRVSRIDIVNYHSFVFNLTSAINENYLLYCQRLVNAVKKTP